MGGLTGLLSRCRLVISNDTGPLHLAAAAGTPTVGIFWCGNFVNGAPLTRYRHRPVSCWRLTCPVCERVNMAKRCEHDVSFVADVTVEEVVVAAIEILARSLGRFSNASGGAAGDSPSGS